MDEVSDHICPVCERDFATTGGRNRHLHTARSCSWYKSGKLPALDLDAAGGNLTVQEPLLNQLLDGENPSNDVDEDPADIMADLPDYYGDLFHFVPLEPAPPDHRSHDVEIGEAGPGPATEAARAAIRSQHVLEDDDDKRVVEEDPRHGRCIRMDEGLHRRWKEVFIGGIDEEGDAEMGDDRGSETNAFLPFASELDYQIANWVVRDEPGHNAFNRLLAIPGVSLIL